MLILKVFVMIVSLLILTPFSYGGETQVKEKAYNIPKCPSPVGKISLGKITCKASSCQKPQIQQSGFLQQLMALTGQPSFENIGDGIGDMLLTALKQTNCFDIMEREALEELRKEMELMGKTLQLEAADFLISGSINSIGMDTTQTNLGLGFIPLLSAIDVKKTTANIAMDIRLIDVKSAKILMSKTYEANSSKTGLGIGAAGWGSGVGFGGAFSSLKGTSMEEVARDVMVRAVIDIVDNINLRASSLVKTEQIIVPPAASVPMNIDPATSKEDSTNKEN